MEILREPSCLGRENQSVIKYNSDDNKTQLSQNSLSTHTSEKFLLVRHQPLVFEGQECQMITVRDLTQYYVCKFANDQIGYLSTLNATVSHEMMTPLNCVVAFAEKIKVESADKDAQSKANIISKTSKLIKMNLKDLLDRNLQEKGTLDPVFTPNRPSDLLEEVVEIMQYQADN